MASRVVGLDIGTSGVRAAELTLGKGGATLERFGQVALPVGAVRDGEVADSDAVAAAIRQLWTQAKFSTKKVVVGVANQKVVVRQVDLPWMADGELRKALAFQVQDYVPMPVEQAILDFHRLEEFTNESGARMLRVLLVAAARDMVGSAIDAVQKAGLQPQMVDLTSFAVLRSLVGLEQGGLEPTGAEALVDVGAQVTNIVIHQGGVPRFVRILLMGGGDITDALAERLGVPAEQAEAIKQESGMAGVPGAAESSPAGRAIEGTANSFVEEVRGSLDYYMAQPGATRIDRVVLSGGGSRLTGLADRLATATRLPVQAARPLSTLKLGKTGLTPDQLAYVEPMVTVPVGLAMGVSS
ncbi:MAG: type pilus assembly protein PilM [Frankiales bacterium]|nr:type pilus assembly protein PilM [Frankiales bacterium]